VGAVTPWLRRSSWAPWAGVFVGALGWFAHHQIASNADYWNCRAGGPLLTAGLGALCLLIVAAGGVVSWRARAAPPSSAGRPESRTFAASVGAGASALFAFAILLQALSGFIVPGCLR
jgi:hypothetical protein